MVLKSCAILSNRKRFRACSIEVRDDPGASSSSSPSGPANHISKIHFIVLVETNLAGDC